MTYPQVPATTQRSYSSQIVTSVASTGLTGATAASRYAGATASGHPASGTFAVGDFVIDQSGAQWVCTAAGTPGTWAQTGVVNNGAVIRLQGGADSLELNVRQQAIPKDTTKDDVKSAAVRAAEQEKAQAEKVKNLPARERGE